MANEKKKENSKQSDKTKTLIELDFTAQSDILAAEAREKEKSTPESGQSGVQGQPQIISMVKGGNEVDVLEAQIKLIALFASESKVLEKELNRLIKQIYSKSPDSKPYLLKMKKLLKEFSDIDKILNDARLNNSEAGKSQAKNQKDSPSQPDISEKKAA